MTTSGREPSLRAKARALFGEAAAQVRAMCERGAGLYALLANAILCQFDQLAAPAAPSSPALRA